MNKTKLRNLLKLFLKIGFTALLLYFVLKKIHPEELIQIFKRSNPFYLLIAFLVFCLSQVASSWRLLTFFKNIPVPISFLQNLKLYTVGMFYNIFLPGGIGGDGYKIYLLNKQYENVGVKKFLNAVLLDRVSGLWALGLGIVSFSFFLPIDNSLRQWGMLIYISGSGVYFFIVKKLFKMFAPQLLFKHLKAIAVQSLQLICATCILVSISPQQDYLPYLFTFLVSSMVSVIPITIGGLGAREYVMIYAATILNFDESTGVFLTATFWLLSAIASASGVYFALQPKKIFVESVARIR